MQYIYVRAVIAFGVSMVIPLLAFGAIRWDTTRIEPHIKPGQMQCTASFAFQNVGSDDIKIESGTIQTGSCLES